MRLNEDSKILVSGGAGLIGSNLIHQLNKIGIESIWVVDRIAHSSKWKHLVPLKFRDYIEVEDFSKSTCGFIPTGLDYIFHLGACSNTTETDATYFIHNNFEFSKVLAQFAVEQNKHFIYASSAATYGNEEGDDSTVMGWNPLNLYGYSKQLFDMWAHKEGILDKITGLKYFNVFGPNEEHKGNMKSVALKAFESIQKDGVVKLFKSYRDDIADGEQRRDFIYVEDAARMTIKLAQNGATGIFNIGSGVASTWNELANNVIKTLGKGEIQYVNMPVEMRDKYQYCTCANMSKYYDIVNDVGSTFSLYRGVRDYINNYLLLNRCVGA